MSPGADERDSREHSGMYDHWDDVRDVIAEREDDHRREQYEDHSHEWPYVDGGAT